MSIVKRLRLLTGVLGVVTVTAVIGSTVFGDLRGSGRGGSSAPPAERPDGERLTEQLVRSKFSNQPALSYKTRNGETIFAWQVKPTLAAKAEQPRDLLIMVDTSASQAGSALERSRQIIAALLKEASPSDRIDLWTVNINHSAATRSLSEGFQPASDARLQAALAKLADAEYGAGAVDLKAALERVIQQFSHKPGRNQVILYLGDGESSASLQPFNEAERIQLGHRLADREIAFFAVPLGVKVNAFNLHGLASLSGGTVVRVPDDLSTVKARADAAALLRAAFAAPILRPERVRFSGEIAEIYPSRLPPLRTDRPTLVLGQLKQEVPALTATIIGRVGEEKVTIDLAERIPEAKSENFFLHAMLQQWRSAANKDAPALLAADRALAMACAQFTLYRDEYLAQGVWAISSDKLDHAEKLFLAAAQIDPESVDAQAGVRVVRKMRQGELSREKLQKVLAGSKPVNRLQELGQDPPAAGGVAQPPAQAPAAPAGSDPAIERARAAQAIIDQEFRVLVDETLRQARRLRDADPDAAYEDLKRQLEGVRSNEQLSPLTRRRLAADLEAAMQDIQVRGAEIKRQLAAQRERIATSRQRLTEFERQLTQEEQTRARIAAFKELMQQARFELAYSEAQVMIQERISRGLTVPPEAAAAYRIGQAATNLREARELKRLRQERFLLTMMQVEKSFVPYPDEPPVHFPPATVWRELTARRQAAYTSSSLGPAAPESMKRLESILEGQRVNLDTPLNGLSLKALLDTLRDKYQIPFFVRDDLFRAQGAVEPINDKKFQITSSLNGVTLGSFLDVVLLDLEASYIVRPEYIEIVPAAVRLTEKQFRAFEVADLVIPIPNSVNNQVLSQNLALFGAQLQFFGQSLGQANFLGGFGGGIAGVPVGFGGPLGGAGPLGAPGGPLGAPGGPPFGGGGGPVNNLGVQGGIQGVTGGQLGQFGNLGGQFGLQGGDQANLLIDLIRLVVAYREWDNQYVGVQPSSSSQEGEDTTGPIVPVEQLNSLGYYPPALALVVRGSTRYHPNSSFKLKTAGGGLMGAAPNGRLKNGDKLAGQPGQGKPKPAGNAALAPAQAPDIVNPKETARGVLAKAGKNPQRVWNEAFDRAITDPNLVLTAAETMVELGEYAHAAEALKAGLRKGRTNGGWAFDALTLALQECQASPAEVERAALSAIDLEPQDPNAFLKAAKIEHELGQSEMALALCQRAAAIEPNLPTTYANALVYAEKSSDVKADVVHWATANLLRRDWPADGIDYHELAKERVEKIATKYQSQGHQAEAQKLQQLLLEEKTRDLVVELRWQGSADLDLSVLEPAGSTCSPTHPRTTGGGVLRGDILEQRDDNRSEVYTASQGFSGTYQIQVRSVLGMPVGNKAQVLVTKHAGTDHQEVQVYTVNLAAPKPILVTLEAGSRKELATIPPVPNPLRASTTDAPLSFAPSGLSAGVTAGSANLMSTPTRVNTVRAMPLVNTTAEEGIHSEAPGLPGLRVAARVSPDRTRVEMTANPVFAGQASDIPLPRVRLLPGGE